MSDLSIADIIEILGILVMLASAIAAATPTDSDNRIGAAVIRAVDAFAINWGARNPRKLQSKQALADRLAKMRGPGEPLAVLAVLTLPLLGGCAALETQDRVVAGRQALVEHHGLFGEADREMIRQTILSYNDAGYDPVQFDADRLRTLDLACMSLMLAGSLVTGQADPMLISDCALVREALAAASVTAPPPIPRPDGS